MKLSKTNKETAIPVKSLWCRISALKGVKMSNQNEVTLRNIRVTKDENFQRDFTLIFEFSNDRSYAMIFHRRNTIFNIIQKLYAFARYIERECNEDQEAL